MANQSTVPTTAGPGLGTYGDYWDKYTKTVNPAPQSYVPNMTGQSGPVNSAQVYPQTSGSVLGTSYTSSPQAPSAPSAPTPYTDSSTGQTFGSYDDFMNEINNVYSGSENYLNDAENAVRSDQPNALKEAESIFNTNVSTLGNQKQTAFGQLDQQQTKATSTKENALADARRLYQEQQMGANQRFGGSSSAGQAVSELQAREQARQFGQTGRQYADITNQIDTQRNTVEREYQTGMLQLEQQKQTAIANVTRDFQNKLLQISNSRAMLGQAKAEAKLSALQNLRSEVFAIQQQNTQFTQQLEMMRQQALLSAGNYGQSTGGAVGMASNAASTQYQAPSTQYAATAGLGGQQSQAPQYTGAIKKEEQPTGQMGFGGRLLDYLKPAFNMVWFSW